MSAGSAARRKGLVGERDVADRFRAAGWTVRGLEGSGDWLALRPAEYGEHEDAGTYEIRPASTLHVECKRQERLRLPEWLEQAANEAPPGVAPLVVFRQNRGEWYVCLRLADYLEAAT